MPKGKIIKSIVFLIALLFFTGCQYKINIPFFPSKEKKSTTTVNSNENVNKKVTRVKETPPVVLNVTKNPNDLPLDSSIANGQEECYNEYDGITPSQVCLITQGSNFYVKNGKPGFITATLELDSQDVITTVVNPSVITKIYTASYSPSSKKLFWQSGLKDAVHDDSYVYTLPYEIGTYHVIGQGYNSVMTHYGNMAYALDFLMDEGTPVLASREGIVVEVLDESNESYADPSYAPKTNAIAIHHSDGTIARYEHNQYKTAKVKLGDQVKVGQEIALAGCTGYCGGAHVHFQVDRPTNGRTWKTVPTTFQIDAHETGKIVESVTYVASGDEPIADPTAGFPEDSIVRLPARLEEKVNAQPDKEKAAEAFRDYLKENKDSLHQKWNTLYKKSLDQDPDALKELGVYMNECIYCMDINADWKIARIFDPDKGIVSYDPLGGPENERPGVPEATNEGIAIWNEIFTIDD